MSKFCYPDFTSFGRIAHHANVVPVFREYMGDLLTPVGVFRKLVPSIDLGIIDDAPNDESNVQRYTIPRCFLLESVEHSSAWGRYSFVGLNPLATLITHGQDVICEDNILGEIPGRNGILNALEFLLTKFSSPQPDVMPEMASLPSLTSGIIGYLGYDVVREVEEIGETPIDDLGVPDAIMSIIGDMVAFDHFRQKVFLIANVIVDSNEQSVLEAAYASAVSRIDKLEQALCRASEDSEKLLEIPPVPVTAGDILLGVRRQVSKSEFTIAVNAAKESILSGDAFQIVLSQRFDLEETCDPFMVYRYLRQVNPSPYMYLVANQEAVLVGSSPEPMVQLLDGTVISRPIAGTRKRGKTHKEDELLGVELRENPKELAEHVMLVDLARNDLGRICEFSSEQVDELMTLEHYSHVMHLTSQVSGKLQNGKGPIDVLKATLPAGTVTGAPKVSAMKIINMLENTKRGPYAGVVGYFDFSGNLDTAITIRTMVFTSNGKIAVQAGAGIVADSDPEMEDLECINKASALLAVGKCAASCNSAPFLQDKMGKSRA